MILFQNTAYSAKNRAVESYENWVSSPSQESLGKLVSQVKRLNREDVLALIRSGNLLSFSGIVYLPTILSKYEKFDSIYEHCIKDYGDLEKAICISAMMKWKEERGQYSHTIEKESAIKLLDSKKKSAGQLIALILPPMNYYSEQLFNNALDVLRMDLSREPLGAEIIKMYTYTLGYITYRFHAGPNMNININHYETWLKKNKKRLLPSKEEVRDNRLYYTNYLRGYALDLPQSFKRVSNPKQTQAIDCFYSDPIGRSIFVEIYPKSASFQYILDQKSKEGNVADTKNTFVSKFYPATTYSIKLKQGYSTGIIVDTSKYFIVVTSLSSNENVLRGDLEKLLDGLTIMENS